MKKLWVLACVVCTAAAAAAGAAGEATTVVVEPGFTVSSAVDWTAGTLAMEITHALDPSLPSLVRAKADAETDIDGRFSDFLFRAVAPLTVDSSHTLGDLLGLDPAVFAKFNELDFSARRDELFLSRDFSSLVARYTLPLFGANGIASPLLPSRATPPKRRLGYVATRKFTGLLIYAKGQLPEAGTGRTAQARPALFPRIWDEQMNLVLDKGMCDPGSLAKWGMVGYALQPDEDAALLRAGNLPLRLAARGVFGDTPTDIVIPTEGALQLLTLPENIALLREGRIVIIYDRLR
jgi:hypothetical protein